MKKLILNLENKTVGNIDLILKFWVKAYDLIHQYGRYQNAKSRQGSYRAKVDLRLVDV